MDMRIQAQGLPSRQIDAPAALSPDTTGNRQLWMGKMEREVSCK